MNETSAHVFTIPSDAAFLDILSKAILNGFPISGPKKTTVFNLAAWTVFVPTRRAARELQAKLLKDSGQSALVLPSIRPIGDVDEDLLEAQDIDAALPNEISSIGRQFMLVNLIDNWAKEYSHLNLAREILSSPKQAQSLAASLGDLIDSLETEEVSLGRLPEAYQIDLASHRESILTLLELIRTKLPTLLMNDGLMGSKERRSRLLRLEAQRLRENPPSGPVIAAGSTGTIPATRELLKAISQLENGVVILPGLDQVMDSESWASVSPQHPQYALKQFIDELGVERLAIPVLGAAGGKRDWLASELMRASDVADKWQTTLKGRADDVRHALENVSLIEAQDKNEEALIISLIMRRALEKPSGDVALVTPDRDLARRVKSALSRWNIAVDDSAGEPLSRFGAAALLVLLMDVVQSDFSPPSLSALFTHHLAKFGYARESFKEATRNIEITVFRGSPMGEGLNGFLRHFEWVAENAKQDSHPHPLVRRLAEEAWPEMRHCVQRMAEILLPLSDRPPGSFAGHLEALVSVAENLAGSEFQTGEEAAALGALIDALRDEGRRFPDCDFARAAIAIRQQLQLVAFRNTRNQTARLAILGLLEARLIRPEAIILGGLNEMKWPRQSDAGPWLNRPMRDTFGMQQPERQIGQTAHDFVQAFGADQVFLTWSRRDGMEPALPSRWILRLKTIVKAVGLDPQNLSREPWQDWAKQLDQPEKVVPCGKPLPRPAVSARPQGLSVTRIETLIRDPYAIYANAILGIEPLEDVAAKPDAALRGTLFHNAIGEFFGAHPHTLPADALEQLIATGKKHFLPYGESSEIMSFWWSRYLRLAQWIIDGETALRLDLRKSRAEVRGSMELDLGPSKFTLKARADRIDILGDGRARIIDYKTGTPPSADEVTKNFSPQLTLEAAMLASGAFEGMAKAETAELLYIRITGGVPPGELKPLKLPPMDAAWRHLAGLIDLLKKYLNADQAYIPRFGMQNEDDVGRFDHLSRHREWILSGETP